MRYVFLLLVVISLLYCQNAGFESDERQIIAKDVIRKQMHRARSFDVVDVF